jgi:hypothetical protein
VLPFPRRRLRTRKHGLLGSLYPTTGFRKFHLPVSGRCSVQVGIGKDEAVRPCGCSAGSARRRRSCRRRPVLSEGSAVSVAGPWANRRDTAMRCTHSCSAGISVIHFGSGSFLLEEAPDPTISLPFCRKSARCTHSRKSWRETITGATSPPACGDLPAGIHLARTCSRHDATAETGSG